MKHYKDENNNIYAYELDGSQDEYIKEGLVQITDEELAVLRTPTQEQLAAIAAEQANQARTQAMLTGFTYNGHQISVTAEDGTGLLQVKGGFELGVTETTIHFTNGTKLPMTASEFPAFALLFVTERNKYFV